MLQLNFSDYLSNEYEKTNNLFYQASQQQNRRRYANERQKIVKCWDDWYELGFLETIVEEANIL